MAVPPSLPPRTQLERNRFRYHLPLSTLYPRRFSTFLHLIPSPTAPSLVAPLIKCEIPLGVLSPFISFQSADPLPPVCLFLDLEEKERERERYIYTCFPSYRPFLLFDTFFSLLPRFRPVGSKGCAALRGYCLPPYGRERRLRYLFNANWKMLRTLSLSLSVSFSWEVEVRLTELTESGASFCTYMLCWYAETSRCPVPFPSSFRFDLSPFLAPMLDEIESRLFHVYVSRRAVGN